MPNRAVPCLFNTGGWKLFLWRLKLLQTVDIRFGLLQPAKQDWKPSSDAVDIVRDNFHILVDLVGDHESLCGIVLRLRQAPDLLPPRLFPGKIAEGY
jgi:hypothetical protein